MATPSKDPVHALPQSVSAPTLQQATTGPASTGDSWTLTASLGQSLVGSLLLSPKSWCIGSVCALPESVSPVLCKFWQLYGGVNGDLLQEGLCHPQVCCTQSPRLCGSPLLTCASAGDTHSIRSGSVSVGSPGVPRVLFEPSEHFWWVWDLILNAVSPLLPSGWGFSFALGWGVSSFGGIQHCPVDGCSAASCNFGVLAEELLLRRLVCLPCPGYCK